ncbi:sensor histidine kinase [Massilia sp. W12]|uniref:sensor histidine kinase n=1 Tax=Massilia sp. W12 TaxID=3126507 RepID=UPI0030D19544
MPISILLQIVSRAFLWIFLLSIDVAGPLLFMLNPGVEAAYAIWLGLACISLLATWAFAEDDVVRDLRELSLYGVLVQSIALLLYKLGYPASMFSVSLSGAIFLLKYLRLLWPAKTADGRHFSAWPVFGLYGWWRARRGAQIWPPSPAQARQCWLALGISLALGILMASMGLVLKIAYFCLAAMFAAPLLHRITRRELLEQHQRYLCAVQAAQRAAARASIEHSLAAEQERHNRQLEANHAALAEAHRQNAQLLQIQQQQAHQLQRYNAALRDAAHDLQQPLALARVCADNLIRRCAGSERAASGEQLQEALRQLGESIESSIHGAQIVTGVLPAQAVAIDLRALTQRFSADWQSGPLRHVRLSLRVSRRVRQDCEADLQIVQRILRNLLSNAARHVRPEGRVLLSVRAQRQQCLVQVWDQGPGIAEGEGGDGHANFLAFVARLRKEGSRCSAGGGYRLGMNNVLQLCMAGGIRIQLHARKGRGAVFSFFVPYSRHARFCAMPTDLPQCAPQLTASVQYFPQRNPQARCAGWP